MAIRFNPLTGNFDFTGSGGGGGGGASYIDGEVATYTDLPLDGSAALNTAWLVREASGAWLLARKPAGIYIRSATAGVSRDADYTYAGILPDVFNDANFLLYDNGDSSKNLAFQLSGITTGTTRTLTAPDASGRIQVEGQPIGNTTPAAGTFTTLTANSGTIYASAPVLNASQTWAGASFTGEISGTTLTVTAVSSGVITNGMRVTGGSTSPNTFITALGTGTGGTGTYTINNSQTRASTTLTGTSSFTGLQVSITDTSSEIGSRLMEVTATGGYGISFRKGNVFGRVDLVSQNSAMQFFTAGGAGTDSGVSMLVINSSDVSVSLTSTGMLGWSNDCFMMRDAADTVAIRRANADNAQTLHVYGRRASATNYQRLAIKTKAVTLSALTGASVATTGGFIPDGAVLVGLTTRVSTAITGATGYDIGDGSDADRWGANIGIALNTSSDNTNWTAGTIECFTAAQEVTLTAVGSNFTGGAVVIVAHYLAGEAD
jgi:hypothetical protein